ncbi:dolichol-phosphate mannosyltransferase [Marinicauda pacifica]|uniref:Glycosyltransferase n=1 Tax=Marinicauda pacifica TaxID=1133559 RepID=A0A4S2H8J2_9PROT|nr:glycosyltransferase [Marinicauda pacifica]TGY92155.1 glycosyltransferase [Marinicauda pacifica]GGE46436.1 dolichol-phosphate mannosyltransferase [Marinicauda pacifica]
MPAPQICVVAPMHNEAGNAARLAAEVYDVLRDIPHEIVFVNDASTDSTLDELVAAKADIPSLRVISHRSNAGQSRAIRSGVMAATAPVICTLDGDGQNPPADIPAVFQALTRADAPADLAMVAGRRVGRKDTAAKRFASRLGNGIRKRLLNDDADDTGCGLKAFKREAYLRLPYFDHQHRFLPALVKREGFKIEFVDVGHRPRLAGKSKYSNLGRLFASFSDMLGVMWLNSRFRKTGGWDES